MLLLGGSGVAFELYSSEIGFRGLKGILLDTQEKSGRCETRRAGKNQKTYDGVR